MDSEENKFDMDGAEYITLQNAMDNVNWSTHFDVPDVLENSSGIDFEMSPEIKLEDCILDQQRPVPDLPTSTNISFDKDAIKLQPYLSNKNKWNVMHKQKTFLFLRSGRSTIDWQCTLRCRRIIKTTFANGDDVQLLKDVLHKEECQPKMRPRLITNCGFVFDDTIKAVCLRIDGYKFKRNGGVKKGKTYWQCIEKKCPATASSLASCVYLIKEHDINLAIAHHPKDVSTSIRIVSINGDVDGSQTLLPPIGDSLPSNFVADVNTQMDVEAAIVLNENIINEQHTLHVLPTTNVAFDENSIQLKPYLSKKHKWNVMHNQKSFLFLRAGRSTIDWQCTLGSCKRTIKTTFINGDSCKLIRDVEHKEQCDKKIKAIKVDDCSFEYDACDRAVSLKIDQHYFKRNGGVKKGGKSYWQCTEKKCSATASSIDTSCVRLIKGHNH